MTHLIPDVYNIQAEGPGFKAFEAKNIVVSADASARVDGRFQVGGSSETVEVTAEAPQLKTDRADVATIFNDKAVEDCPVQSQFHLAGSRVARCATIRLVPRFQRKSPRQLAD